MKKLVSISEVIDSAGDWRGGTELCARAEAGYDETALMLVVELDACTRIASGHGEESVPRWLPRSQIVREKVGIDEADAAAREIFQRWVRRVRDSIPAAPET